MSKTAVLTPESNDLTGTFWGVPVWLLLSKPFHILEFDWLLQLQIWFFCVDINISIQTLYALDGWPRCQPVSFHLAVFNFDTYADFLQPSGLLPLESVSPLLVVPSKPLCLPLLSSPAIVALNATGLSLPLTLPKTIFRLGLLNTSTVHTLPAPRISKSEHLDLECTRWVLRFIFCLTSDVPSTVFSCFSLISNTLCVRAYVQPDKFASFGVFWWSPLGLQTRFNTWDVSGPAWCIHMASEPFLLVYATSSTQVRAFMSSIPDHQGQIIAVVHTDAITGVWQTGQSCSAGART